MSFDWEFYVARHPDLKTVGIRSHKEAYGHWMTHGRQEGRICCDPIFDWRFYVELYPDLREAGIDTYEKAYGHWVEYGRREARMCRDPAFNWRFYVSTDPSLRGAGIDTYEKAYGHWLEKGRTDGISDPEFDWKFYVNKYRDLRDTGVDTLDKAYDHWSRYGKDEGRVGNPPESTGDRLIVVSHHGGGGLSQYVRDLIRLQAGTRFEIFTNEEVNDERINVVSDWLVVPRIERSGDRTILHLNTLQNVLTTPCQIDHLIDLLLERRSLKLILTIHDYFWLNPQDPCNLLRRPRPEMQPVCQKLFARADLIIFPTECVVDVHRRYGINLDGIRYVVHPHRDIRYDDVKPYCPLPEGNVIKILYLGPACRHKGFDTVLGVMRFLPPRISVRRGRRISYTVTLHVAGDTRPTGSSRRDSVVYHGKYVNDGVFRLINEIRPTVIILPSLFEETWSYVLSICLRTGLPLFYNNIGAYRERITRLNRGNVSAFDSATDDVATIGTKLVAFLESIVGKSSSPHIRVGEDYTVIPDPFYDGLYSRILAGGAGEPV